MKKDIELALEEPVKTLMKKADEYRDPVSKQIPIEDADMLSRAATQDAAHKLRSSVGKKVSTWELERKIAAAVPGVVEKVKKQRVKRGKGY
jgi:CYTH domain-containing protein